MEQLAAPAEAVIRAVLALIAPLTICTGLAQAAGMDLTNFYTGRELKLAQAAQRGDAAEVARLVKAGADPNAISKTEKAVMLSIIIAAGNLEGVRALLDNGANPNKSGDDKLPPMWYATVHPSIESLKLLIARGGDPNTRIHDGNVPIIESAASMDGYRWNQILYLLDHGADINLLNGSGENLVTYFARLRQFDKVYPLLERGADPMYPRDDPEMTAAAYIYHEVIEEKEFPEAVMWQHKSQEFLRAKGIPDPVDMSKPNEWNNWLRPPKP